jgi:glutamate racemase
MIGVFDSGIGGLSVVKEIINHLPGFQIIYFGDTARLPYGTKGADFVKRYSAKIVDWLSKNGAQIIVIACHTSSAWASDFLKQEFKDLPIFEVITPALKDILQTTRNKKIGIIGTPGTIKSNSWERHLLKLSSDLKIYSKACPLFVSLVEEAWIDKKITREITEEYLKELKDKDIDTLVLACTHYPFLEKAIKNTLGRNIKIINPAESLAKELRIFLDDNIQIRNKIKQGSNHQFFFSDEPYNFNKIAKLCLAQEIKPKIINEII